MAFKKSIFFQQKFFDYFPNNILINCLIILFLKYIYLVLYAYACSATSNW